MAQNKVFLTICFLTIKPEDSLVLSVQAGMTRWLALEYLSESQVCWLISNY